MDAYKLEFDLPQEPDRYLDHLLAQWAGEHRLASDLVTAIREAILATPLDLDFDWWWQTLRPAGAALPQVVLAATTTRALASDPKWAGEVTTLIWSP